MGQHARKEVTVRCLAISVATLGLLGVLLFPGCAAGPNYKAPKMKVGPNFDGANEAGFSTNDATITWWRNFEDSQLDTLIERASTNNLDVRIATANLREARALYRNAQFDFIPSVNGVVSYANSRLSRAALSGFPGLDRSRELYDVGFDATWELDVFGRVRRSVESAGAAVEAAEANRRDVLVSLTSEIARNYFELRGTQHELEVARRNATNQEETVKITTARLEGGRGTELDVARARAQLNTTLATIPPFESSIARAIHRLSVLLGRQPSALAAQLNEPRRVGPLPALVSIGTPEELLRRRPDIRVAERRLASATANIGVAVADLFPRVTFDGNIALEASTLSGLGGPASDTFSFGPKLSWAIFDYGHVRARIRAAGARAEASLAGYEQVVLNALEETENALVEFNRQQQRARFLDESVKQSETAARLARQRFENGATDFLTVLDAERVLLEAQTQLARSQTETATALIAIYKALGGGWENR